MLGIHAAGLGCPRCSHLASRLSLHTVPTYFPPHPPVLIPHFPRLCPCPLPCPAQVLAGFHYDLNALTIHGRSRYPGLYVWTRDGGKRTVKIPAGCLLVQAGKQMEYATGGHVSRTTRQGKAKAHPHCWTCLCGWLVLRRLCFSLSFGSVVSIHWPGHTRHLL